MYLETLSFTNKVSDALLKKNITSSTGGQNPLDEFEKIKTVLLLFIDKNWYSSSRIQMP